MIEKSDWKKWSKELIQRSDPKKWSKKVIEKSDRNFKFQVSSLKERWGGERGAAKNKNVILITFATWWAEKEKKVIEITFVGLAHRTKKWLKSLSRRTEQKSDWRLSWWAEKTKKWFKSLFYGLAQRTEKWLKSLFGLGTQRRNKRDSNHFFKFQVSRFKFEGEGGRGGTLSNSAWKKVIEKSVLKQWSKKCFKKVIEKLIEKGDQKVIEKSVRKNVIKKSDRKKWLKKGIEKKWLKKLIQRSDPKKWSKKVSEKSERKKWLKKVIKKVFEKSDRKKWSKNVIEKSHRKKWSKFQVSSLKERGGGERGAAKNKKVILITFATWWAEKEKKWLKSHMRLGTQREGKKVIQIIFRLGAQNKKVIESTFFGLAHREDIKEIRITFSSFKFHVWRGGRGGEEGGSAIVMEKKWSKKVFKKWLKKVNEASDRKKWFKKVIQVSSFKLERPQIHPYQNVADANTKSSDRFSLEFCRSKMGVTEIPKQFRDTVLYHSFFPSLCHRSWSRVQHQPSVFASKRDESRFRQSECHSAFVWKPAVERGCQHETLFTMQRKINSNDFVFFGIIYQIRIRLMSLRIFFFGRFEFLVCSKFNHTQCGGTCACAVACFYLQAQHLKWHVFAVQKCAENGYREKWRSTQTVWQQVGTGNRLKLGPRWNWDQKWKSRNCTWLRGNIA